MKRLAILMDHEWSREQKSHHGISYKPLKWDINAGAFVGCLLSAQPCWVETVNSPHKGPVTRKMFPIDDVIVVVFQTWVLWVARTTPVTVDPAFSIKTSSSVLSSGSSSSPSSSSSYWSSSQDDKKRPPRETPLNICSEKVPGRLFMMTILKSFPVIMCPTDEGGISGGWALLKIILNIPSAAWYCKISSAVLSFKGDICINRWFEMTGRAWEFFGKHVKYFLHTGDGVGAWSWGMGVRVGWWIRDSSWTQILRKLVRPWHTFPLPNRFARSTDVLIISKFQNDCATEK